MAPCKSLPPRIQTNSRMRWYDIQSCAHELGRAGPGGGRTALCTSWCSTRPLQIANIRAPGTSHNIAVTIPWYASVDAGTAVRAAYNVVDIARIGFLHCVRLAVKLKLPKPRKQ